MSQRIGVTFPIAMIMAGLLFVPYGADDNCSHYMWLKGQLGLSPDQKGKKRHYLPLLWLVVQWLLPLRMPFVSNWGYKYTMLGYRFGWTMMLHGKKNFHSPGIAFMALRPKCSGDLFPNPAAMQNPYIDVNGVPYEHQLSGRGLVVVSP